MGKLTFEIKEFIEDNIDLIEDRAWDQIYDNAQFNLDSESTGGFTLAMLSIGEDPLEYLDYIPDYYLSDTSISTFNIPTNMRHLMSGCFSYCHNMKYITIPDNVEVIGDYAFYDAGLERIIIPPTVHEIGIQALYPHSAVVVCKAGTAAAHYAIENDMEVEY